MCVYIGRCVVLRSTKALMKLASRCFELGQPQTIISEPKTNLNPSPSYSVHKALYHKSLFLRPQTKNYIHGFGTQTQKNSNMFSEHNLFSAGTQHENLNQLSVTTSRMTCFILQVHTGTGVSHSQIRCLSIPVK